MTQANTNTMEDYHKTAETPISRRIAIGSSGVVALGVLCHSAFGREEGRDAGRAGMPQDV
jgi:hypothetical protein